MTRIDARRHDLDALRAFAMLIGIALHAGLSFVVLPWVVQDRNQHDAFGIFFAAVHGFRMPVFFLLSGFFTAMLWRNRGLRSLLWHRTRRIALPLLLGMFTIVPVMWGAIFLAGAAGPPEYDPPARADTADTDVWTAAATGNTEALKRFAAKGDDLEQMDPKFGQTPLAWAVIGDQPEAVALLLRAGADPNTRYRDRTTALHTAAFFGRAKCAKQLIEAGAQVDARNDHGQVPLQSLKADRGTTRFIANILGIGIDFEKVEEGRKSIVVMLQGDESPLGEEAPSLAEVLLFLTQFPLFGHLWFLWFLCWLVAGFALVVWLAPKIRLPAPPGRLTSSPARWLWVVPLTMLPQFAMHQWGRVPGFGPDLSAGVLPVPSLLLYYAIFFAFGALYHDARDEEGKLGRAWWANLGLGLILFPVSLSFSLRFDWTRNYATGQAHHVIAVALEVFFTWLMVFGFMGLFRRLLARERYWVRYLSDASYWLYLAHLPLIIAGQVLVRDWRLPAFVKFTFLLVGVTAILMVMYRYLVRYTLIGRILNGPRKRPGSA